MVQQQKDYQIFHSKTSQLTVSFSRELSISAEIGVFRGISSFSRNFEFLEEY